jgi:hypothetical protein
MKTKPVIKPNSSGIEIKQQLAKAYLELHREQSLLEARKKEIAETLNPLLRAVGQEDEQGKVKIIYEKIEVEGLGWVGKYQGSVTKDWTKEGSAQKVIWEESVARFNGWFQDKQSEPYVKAGGIDKAK